MDKLRKKIKEKPHLAISIPTLVCFLAFITNLVTALRDGNIDSNELHQLLSSADAFQAVFLVVIMYVLKDKSK